MGYPGERFDKWKALKSKNLQCQTNPEPVVAFKGENGSMGKSLEVLLVSGFEKCFKIQLNRQKNELASTVLIRELCVLHYQSYK